MRIPSSAARTSVYQPECDYYAFRQSSRHIGKSTQNKAAWELSFKTRHFLPHTPRWKTYASCPKVPRPRFDTVSEGWRWQRETSTFGELYKSSVSYQRSSSTYSGSHDAWSLWYSAAKQTSEGRPVTSSLYVINRLYLPIIVPTQLFYWL